MRRHAHRVVKAPRSAWQRSYRYQERPPGWPYGSLRVTTPISDDAPLGPEDARFWDWVLAGVIAAIAIGVLTWALTAIV
jgi:hypothetical protein